MSDLTAEQEKMLAEARAAETPGRVKAVAPTRVQGVDEWGPYDEYKIVPTPTGEFGVAKGEILYFVTETVFSTRENRMIQTRVPRYRTPDEEPVLA